VRGANVLGNEVATFYRETAAGRFSRLVSDLRGEIHICKLHLQIADQQIALIQENDPLLEQRADKGSDVSEQYARLLGNLHDARAKLQADLANASVNDSTLSAALPFAQEDIADSDPLYRAARDQYAQDANKLSVGQAVFHSRFPGERELLVTVAKEQRNYREQQRRISGITPARSATYLSFLNDAHRNHANVEADRASVREVNHELDEMQSRFRSITQRQVNLTTLQRDRDASEAEYTVLSARLASALANRVEAQSVGSVAVLEHAQYADLDPSHRPSIIFLLGCVFTGAMTIGAVLYLEYFDSRLFYAGRIERIYGIPVIAKIVP
jgi:uncharacterized protein involved in exopolysaccharide biosynthesis